MEMSALPLRVYKEYFGDSRFRIFLFSGVATLLIVALCSIGFIFSNADESSSVLHEQDLALLQSDNGLYHRPMAQSDFKSSIISTSYFLGSLKRKVTHNPEVNVIFQRECELAPSEVLLGAASLHLLKEIPEEIVAACEARAIDKLNKLKPSDAQFIVGVANLLDADKVEPNILTLNARHEIKASLESIRSSFASPYLISELELACAASNASCDSVLSASLADMQYPHSILRVEDLMDLYGLLTLQSRRVIDLTSDGKTAIRKLLDAAAGERQLTTDPFSMHFLMLAQSEANLSTPKSLIAQHLARTDYLNGLLLFPPNLVGTLASTYQVGLLSAEVPWKERCPKTLGGLYSYGNSPTLLEKVWIKKIKFMCGVPVSFSNENKVLDNMWEAPPTDLNQFSQFIDSANLVKGSNCHCLDLDAKRLNEISGLGETGRIIVLANLSLFKYSHVTKIALWAGRESILQILQDPGANSSKVVVFAINAATNMHMSLPAKAIKSLNKWKASLLGCYGSKKLYRSDLQTNDCNLQFSYEMNRPNSIWSQN